MRTSAVESHTHIPERPHRTGRQRLLVALGVVATVGCVVAAALLSTVWRKWGQFERVDASELTSGVSDDEPQNFLIVGSDSREAIDSSDPNVAVFTGGGEEPVGQRADTLIVLRYDPGRERLDILSIPRDLWVAVSGTDTHDRINTAYSYEDGPNRLIRTVQETLGIPIHHYAEVDFMGFQDLVDELGGVPMYFETIYQDTNSGFVISEPGCMNLGGQQALAFVRARHLQYMTAEGLWESDPTGDLGRISRQQVFLRKALAEARGTLSVLQPIDMNRMLDIGIAHTRLDQDLEPTVLAAMGQRFAEFEGESIQTHTLPVEEFTTGGGAAVVRLVPALAQPALNVFRGLPPDHLDPSWVEVTVLNGSGVRGQAGLVQEALVAVGFAVTGVGDVPGVDGQPLPRTRVRHAPGSADLAALVERHLSAGADLAEDPTLVAGEVVVETGTDFTTVEEVPRPAAPADGLDTTERDLDPEPDGGAEPGDEASSDGTSSSGGSSSGGSSSATTTTTVIGHVPGAPPEGVTCD